MSIEIRDTVVVDYQIGYITDMYHRGSVDYVSVNVGGRNKVVPERNVVEINKFLAIARKAELEQCDYCRGNGVIYPIDNPPYQCDHCAGRGYFVVKDN